MGTAPVADVPADRPVAGSGRSDGHHRAERAVYDACEFAADDGHGGDRVGSEHPAPGGGGRQGRDGGAAVHAGAGCGESVVDIVVCLMGGEITGPESRQPPKDGSTMVLQLPIADGKVDLEVSYVAGVPLLCELTKQWHNDRTTRRRQSKFRRHSLAVIPRSNS